MPQGCYEETAPVEYSLDWIVGQAINIAAFVIVAYTRRPLCVFNYNDLRYVTH